MVGLVEDGDLNSVQGQVALPDEVLEATGARDHDVDAGTQGTDLRALPDAAVDDA